MKKIALWNLMLACTIWGLEIKPVSLTISPSFVSKISAAIDTITIKNTSEIVVTIDTVTITFLNGDSADFRNGVNCMDYTCFNYNGWSYGALSHQFLRYLRDSLYLLQDLSGNPVRYTLQPHDSMDFIVYSAINCPVCGRMPSFPATTRFRFDFVGGSGQHNSFFLNLENITAVFYGTNQKCDHLVSQQTPCVNLRGQAVNARYSTQVTSIKGKKLLIVKNSVAIPER